MTATGDGDSAGSQDEKDDYSTLCYITAEALAMGYAGHFDFGQRSLTPEPPPNAARELRCNLLRRILGNRPRSAWLVIGLQGRMIHAAPAGRTLRENKIGEAITIHVQERAYPVHQREQAIGRRTVTIELI